ncbi:hypothetical protein HK102_011957 [Quaeritorhiza haematococci]|nr:hypothetical protein HK102_011957 [Quaeritorhiza haematococci]
MLNSHTTSSGALLAALALSATTIQTVAADYVMEVFLPTCSPAPKWDQAVYSFKALGVCVPKNSLVFEKKEILDSQSIQSTLCDDKDCTSNCKQGLAEPLSPIEPCSQALTVTKVRVDEINKNIPFLVNSTKKFLRVDEYDSFLSPNCQGTAPPRQSTLYPWWSECSPLPGSQDRFIIDRIVNGSFIERSYCSDKSCDRSKCSTTMDKVVSTASTIFSSNLSLTECETGLTATKRYIFDLESGSKQFNTTSAAASMFTVSRGLFPAAAIPAVVAVASLIFV